MRLILRSTGGGGGRRAAIAGALLTVLLAASCTDEPPSGRPTVVASFYPLAETVRRVGGDRVEVRDLTPPGVEPHDLELTPEHVDAIVGADLVVYLGAGFQPAIEDAVAMREGVSLDAYTAVNAEPLPGGVEDPHVWLDLRLMGHLVAAVERELTVLDPAGESAYVDGAAAFTKDLQELDAEFERTLGTCERDLLVTAHDAFGRLAARYGLRVEAIAGISPEAEPNPARLAELAELVRREGVTTIFTEELVSAEVAETLAREAGVDTAVLSPIEGLSDEQREAGEDYVSVMRANLAAIAEALGCET